MPLAIPRAAAIAAVAALLIPTTLLSQESGRIVGRALLASSGTPVADLVVRVDGTTRGAVTDAEGRFQIAAVPAGAQTLVAQRVGLATLRQQVEVPAAGTATVRLELSEQATIVAPTIVSATRELQSRAEASATIDVMDGGEIRATRPAHPAQVMNRMAGVHVAELSGEGHSTAIRQPISTKPLYLYLEDGIPTRSTGFFNHNALYEVNLPQAAGIEVLKGPGTALYGSDAIGGVVNVLTRPAPVEPSAEIGVEGGAYGYGRILASGGLTRGSNGLRADLNVTRSDNWKDDAPFRRQSGTVRWDHFRASGLTARTVLTGSNIDQQDVPAISPEQFDADRSFNRAPIAFRKVQALRLSSSVELERGRSLWSVTPYARYNVLELIPSWQLTYDPQLWDTRNSSFGVLARWRRDLEPLSTRVIVGADVDYSPGKFRAQQVVTTPTGERRVWDAYTLGEVHYDYDVTYRQASPYVHVELAPLPRLRVDAGLRWDVAGYDYENHLGPLETGRHRRPASTSVDYSHLSPKLGVSYELSRVAALFGSYRHGFRAPSQGQLFQQNGADNTLDLDPVKVHSWEAGMRGQLGDRMLYQLSAYDMRVEDDILEFRGDGTQRMATNAGETRHRGIEASVGVALAAQLRLDVAWSVSEQRYVSWSPSADVDYSGERIEAAPDQLGSVALTWSAPALNGGRAMVEWNRTGKYAMDPGNVQPLYGGHELLNGYLNYFVPRTGIELFARGVNLLDRDYAELQSWTAAQGVQITPGAPRTIYAGARVEVGR
ncbi:MAG TPA: TonB-dependent receptor [Gemmatimonadales bacterium]